MTASAWHNGSRTTGGLDVKWPVNTLCLPFNHITESSKYLVSTLYEQICKQLKYNRDHTPLL